MKKLVTLPVFLFAFLTIFYSCRHEEGLAPVNDGMVLIKAEVKIEVGGIRYENLDAHLNVSGYDFNNSKQWTKEYDFIGPVDTLEIQNGFHHYSIELVDKWGMNDIQSEIPANEIWDGRADGPRPVTYGLGGVTGARKLSMHVNSIEVDIPGTGIVYQPESRASYVYIGDGRLETIHREIYNTQSAQFEENSIQTFTYEGAVVSKIVTTLNGQLYSEDQYSYGVENKITETLYFNNGLVATQTSTRHDGADSLHNSVKVNYNYSNGNSFLYEFEVLYKNIVSDKTTQYGQVCNQGNYVYDKNINPFLHLGYLDFNFQNWSVNNKLREDVNYQACSFPGLSPDSYDYTYNSNGYPVKKITTYKSSSGHLGHSQLEFYYE